MAPRSLVHSRWTMEASANVRLPKEKRQIIGRPCLSAKEIASCSSDSASESDRMQICCALTADFPCVCLWRYSNAVRHGAHKSAWNSSCSQATGKEKAHRFVKCRFEKDLFLPCLQSFKRGFIFEHSWRLWYWYVILQNVKPLLWLRLREDFLLWLRRTVLIEIIPIHCVSYLMCNFKTIKVVDVNLLCSTTKV